MPGTAAEAPAKKQTPSEQDAAAETHTEETKPKEAPAKPSFDELMKDPEYNSAMQKIIRDRLKSASKKPEEALAALTPALEMLAARYKMDPANMDYAALANAINEDNDFYSKRAMEMGIPVETAKKMEQYERQMDRQQREQAQTLEQQKVMQHFQGLVQQGEKLKEQFPSFDLRTELQNPVFERMTSPSGGVSVEDAYFAVHRAEIQEAGMRAAAEKAAQKISAAVQAGAFRPSENGTSGQAPSVDTIDYSALSREQRTALKQRIFAAEARGEKVYPGQ